MVDPRITQVAKIIVNHSTKIKKNDVVSISTRFSGRKLAKEIYKLALKKGAYPYIDHEISGIPFIYYTYATEEQLKYSSKINLFKAKNTDVFIYLRGDENIKELANVNSKKLALRQKVNKKIKNIKGKKRWVIFEYPSSSNAQAAEMSRDEFEDFVFDSVIANWEKESKKMDKIKKLFDNKKEIRIVSNNTDIKFSLEKRYGVKGDGECNLPDGEIFYAPLKHSVEGHITYDYPMNYNNKEVSGVKLVFKHGKIVEASAEKNQDHLLSMINTDAGARFVGEFGIGTNYKIKKYIKKTLFDEKIGGTIHLALGHDFQECHSNKKHHNKSAIHWDMVKDLRKAGKIFVNNKLVQKNGKFIV